MVTRKSLRVINCVFQAGVRWCQALWRGVSSRKETIPSLWATIAASSRWLQVSERKKRQKLRGGAPVLFTKQQNMTTIQTADKNLNK